MPCGGQRSRSSSTSSSSSSPRTSQAGLLSSSSRSHPGDVTGDDGALEISEGDDGLDVQGDEQGDNATPEQQDDEAGETSVVITMPPPPPRADMDAAVERGTLFNQDRGEFVEQFMSWFDEHGTNPRGKNEKYIVLSDSMSGDSRLVGLYASYMRYPVLYFIDETHTGRRDFAEEYLEQMNVPVYKVVVPNAHDTYSKLATVTLTPPHRQRKPGVVKGGNITETVSDILNGTSYEATREQFLEHVRSMLGMDSVPEELRGLAGEKRPVVVVWTKSNVADLRKGKPEHLLGNTGTAQLLELAKNHGFAPRSPEIYR